MGNPWGYFHLKRSIGVEESAENMASIYGPYPPVYRHEKMERHQEVAGCLSDELEEWMSETQRVQVKLKFEEFPMAGGSRE